MNDAIGLCGACAFSRVIVSARGSEFLLCRLSDTDPQFPRYPRLPVIACAGYREAKGEQAEPPPSS